MLLHNHYLKGVWSQDGWLKILGTNGLLDFAGASVVHMVGGTVGGVGACIFYCLRVVLLCFL